MLSLGSTTITPSQRSAVSNLITRYIQSSLACGWISTATFYCEILNALNPTSEEAVYLFALSLFQDARYRQALELLRCAPAGALHSSVKCRWLYARCCSKVPGREVEGRETLESLANFTSESLSFNIPPAPMQLSPAVLNIDLARLSAQSKHFSQASKYFQKTLEECGWCWEAFDGLCSLGETPDIHTLFSTVNERLLGEENLYKPKASSSISVPSSGGLFTPIEQTSNSTTSRNRQIPIPPPPRFDRSSSLNDMRTKGAHEHTSEYPKNNTKPIISSGGLFTPVNSNSTANIGEHGIRDHDSRRKLSSRPVQPIKRSSQNNSSSLSQPFGSSVFTFEAKPVAPRQGVKNTLVRRSSRLANGGSTSGAGKKRTRTGIAFGESQILRTEKEDEEIEEDENLVAGNGEEAGEDEIKDKDQAFAEEWLREILKTMCLIRLASSQIDNESVVKELRKLPNELRISWRCQMWLARAKFEALDYDAAEKAYTRARAWAPYLISGLEIYSTLLWHLDRPVALSGLAQELMMLDPLSPCAWLAAGNVFSKLDDHTNALKCFKRAVQLDDTYRTEDMTSEMGGAAVYAQTLAGHECAVMEQWERALGCYREALRRNQRHYNAWFGMGNVYMKTGKLRFAEYHFRRATAINPSNAMLTCCVGTVLEKLDRKREALDVYNTACALAPNSPAVLFKRVGVLLTLKQYKSALRDLLTLKDQAPDEFNVHFLLGRLYARMGQRLLMTKHLTLAQDILPNAAPRIREILEGAADSMQHDTSTMTRISDVDNDENNNITTNEMLGVSGGHVDLDETMEEHDTFARY